MTNQPEELPLQRLQRKLVCLRDDVKSVALRYSTGLIVWGQPGICKTWTIQSQLRDVNVAYRPFSGTLTAKGLFQHLQQFPDDVTLIEDQESLLKDKTVLSILRAALWTTERDNRGRMVERAVQWGSDHRREVVMFGGGIIIVQNAAPPQTPDVLAVLSRLLTKEITASTDELSAMMRHLAATAPQNIMSYAMTPEECSEVADFLIATSLSRSQPLHMRLLNDSYGFYVQYQLGDSAQHWHDRIIALIQGRASNSPLHAVDMSGATRRERQERDREIVRKILREASDPKEQLRLWKERTSKGQSMFYERKKDVERLR